MTTKTQTPTRTVTLEEFEAEATARFGDDPLDWKFVCPGCDHVASARDYKKANAPEGAIGFSCIGRYLDTCRDWLTEKGKGPCNYTNGGLFKINTVTIEKDGIRYPVFELGPPDKENHHDRQKHPATKQ